ncbi:hypothetical protein [Marinobacterium arenosum]|uniref:hypothetical protein n=1 Tax=Marinobacterium arenosum TaxID=2862496 RepID=UPI001C94FBC9|nr:hypothetical protein [Marinobacterium arenosum]MBY4677021.1 hypothetical protein [Marinobacterium arenosum]
MTQQIYTGIANDDRRIAAELQAMGAFDQPAEERDSKLADIWHAAGQFITWMRWKGEYGVYGCRVGASEAYRREKAHLA